MLSAAKAVPFVGAQKSARCAVQGAQGYGHILLDAAQAIRAGEYSAARAPLKEYAAKDMECAEAYNLLAISYELEGDRLKASRFYRVSYYIDQTFSAPCENLDRVSDVWYKGAGSIAWGLERLQNK